MRPYTVDMLADGSDELLGAFVAAEYYGGMMSALYALSSTGSLELYPGEGLWRIIGELRAARDIAAAEYPDDYDSLCALLKWCEAEYYRTEGVCEVCESQPATHFPTEGWFGAVSEYCCNCWECDCG